MEFRQINEANILISRQKTGDVFIKNHKCVLTKFYE